uniref:Trk system potassium uptake protein TrkA n=1 Tax=uncultured marine thaumarchaeote AD1000_100_C06 TaxID=1455887 RepID=A0A075FMP6_9ARCH|nr:trk system potassium uptake protein TrkA [uncultured marine thaumarchaeote AD1000_100_C06]
MTLTRPVMEPRLLHLGVYRKMNTIASHLASIASLGKLRRRYTPFVTYVLVLVGVILLYGWLFHVIMAWEGREHSWFTGIYWALTVMSTLGFGDITFTTDLGRAFSSVVLVTGILLLLIILPFLFIRLVYGPWLELQSRRHLKMLRSVPSDLSGHVIICANDPIALGLTERLRVANIPAFVIEPDPIVASRMHDEGRPVLIGEVDALDTYTAARAQHARLVLANASDIVNSNIVLTVRELTSTVPIATVAELGDSVDVLELSGATHVLPLKERLGEHLAHHVSSGSARVNVIGKFHDLLLAEFPVHNTPFQDRTIRETKLRQSTGVTIVGVWERGQLQAAHSMYQLSSSSLPVVIGTPQQIQELDEILVIYDANPHAVIVIGGGKVGRSAAKALKRRNVRVHMVERTEDLKTKIADIPDQLFMGDAADRDLLEAAGVQNAPSILLTTHNDAMNVYLTVYCRRLNPETRVLTRATHERNVEAIRRAGADFVLSLASLGIDTVVSIVQGHELVMLGEGVDIFHIPLPDKLAERSLEDTEIGARTGLSIVGIQENGEVQTNPPASYTMIPGCTLLALGTLEQRQAFVECFE